MCLLYVLQKHLQCILIKSITRKHKNISSNAYHWISSYKVFIEQFVFNVFILFTTRGFGAKTSENAAKSAEQSFTCFRFQRHGLVRFGIPAITENASEKSFDTTFHTLCTVQTRLPCAIHRRY